VIINVLKSVPCPVENASVPFHPGILTVLEAIPVTRRSGGVCRADAWPWLSAYVTTASAAAVLGENCRANCGSNSPRLFWAWAKVANVQASGKITLPDAGTILRLEKAMLLVAMAVACAPGGRPDTARAAGA
jgi:hypothetical protein